MTGLEHAVTASRTSWVPYQYSSGYFTLCAIAIGNKKVLQVLYELNRSLAQRIRRGDVAIQNDVHYTVAVKSLKMLKPVRELATPSGSSRPAWWK